MRTLLFTGLVLAAAASSAAAEAAGIQGVIEFRVRPQDAWRPLLYQLPGAYRFLDRLDLTEEQQKALVKIYNDWVAERRNAVANLPQLSAEDRKNAENVRAYIARRAELYNAAQSAPPVDLIDDVLSDVQLAKMREAARVMEEWRDWLANHMAKYAKALDELLGPVPGAQIAEQQFAYRAPGALVKGGELFDRLGLSSEQAAKLKALWARYQAEYSSLLAPLGHQLHEGPVSYQQQMEVRRVVATKAQEQIRDKYSELAMEILTAGQRELFGKAGEIVEERDKALWRRYEQYVLELSAILPVPTAQPFGSGQ